MISKNEIAFVKELQTKKGRDSQKMFIAEGSKAILDFVKFGFEAVKIYGLTSHKSEFKNSEQFVEVSEAQLNRISQLKTSSSVIAIFKKKITEVSVQQVLQEWSLVLDDIQDPGNLGTIIRTAHWFGIKNIFCSPATVDCYNAKVVQSTMGSLAKVNVFYVDLKELFDQYSVIENFRIAGTFMNGCNLNSVEKAGAGFIVLGNEGNGISVVYEKYFTEKISIPPANNDHPESLNVAIAAAIICNYFKSSEK